ncbi:Nitric oxide-responding transcriptional regulator Dnr (Crp/Fnr family) [hydrothermal vent metagenome]|uniref:Nitric oxide-responding transcriptional regulator Dnr (Crp/Fnr family) n=1 Tax=hydrothermal vent metagenome TaxID=652676 RepID=A0A1W1CFC3_9ZZZZ
MNNRIVENITVIVVSISIISTLSFANTKVSELIDIAGTQRMLSQRIAKDYLYIGKKIAISKATRQLKKSMDDFLSAHKKLSLSINDPEIKNLLDFVELSSNDFNDIASKKFSRDNAQLILDLSESMLEGSEYVFDSLQSSFKIKGSKIIDKSAKQRMLSQRIAKYYISYQSGIKDKNSVDMMKETVKQFTENLDILMKNGKNTPQINSKLAEINKLWKIVHKFYNNIEKGGLPLIVFNTTDNITKKMDEITKLYLLSTKK